MLDVGETAPSLTGAAGDGSPVDLAALRGRWVVLYFYPRAGSPGCTRQTIRFRDRYEELRALGAEVIGVSVDEAPAQCDFGARHEVRFPLVADADGSWSRAFGVLRRLGFDRRVTFVIDPAGRIAARFEHELLVGRHVDDALAFLRKATARTA